MAFTVEESFQVRASPERVWSYLVDPARVVECLPGAELLESEDDRTFRGRMKVSVGPVSVAYEGTAEFVEMDEETRTVTIEARGEEASGPGSARMTMESVVAAGPDGGTEVRVRAEVDVAGKIVQFGRGMIRTISQQLFGQFSDCTRARLEENLDDEPAASTTDPSPEAQPPRAPEREPVRPIRLLLSGLREKIQSLFGR